MYNNWVQNIRGDKYLQFDYSNVKNRKKIRVYGDALFCMIQTLNYTYSLIILYILL